MSEFPVNKNQERRLFRQLTDGEITPEDFRELESRLLKDQAFRRRYLRYLRFEGGLIEILTELGLPRPESTSTLSSSRQETRRWKLLTACLLIMGLIGGASGYIFRSFSLPQEATSSNISKWVPDSRINTPEQIAVVRYLEHSEPGSKLRAGMWLTPGTLSIESGRLELEFIDGAVVAIEGAAEIRLLSGNSATLVRGQAVAHVPEQAKGFKLNGPEAAVVDLGTEFTMSIDSAGQSHVQVLEGEVEVSLLGDDGSTWTSRRLQPSQPYKVNRDDGIQASADLLQQMPRISRRTPEALRTPDDYIRAVLAAAPVFYWRFESIKDGKVRNEVGPKHTAIISGVTKNAPEIFIENHAARFLGDRPDSFIIASDSLSFPEQRTFTIETWVNADLLHHGTLAALIPTAYENLFFHINLLEICHRTEFVHSPGAFRFLNRSPPGEGGGINIFSREECTPGIWQYLVAVNTPDVQQLYLNGELVREMGKSSPDENEPFHILLGQLNRRRPERQFQGLIDELAFYPRALNSEEIQRHHEIMRQHNPD